MATGTAGTTARRNTLQTINYMRRNITFADAGTTITVGTLPAGAIIVAPISGVDVTTVFNAGTNNRINIGITGSTSKYASASSLLATTFVAMAVAIGHRVAVDTPVILTVDVTGTAATTGDADVVIAFVMNNDG